VKAYLPELIVLSIYLMENKLIKLIDGHVAVGHFLILSQGQTLGGVA